MSNELEPIDGELNKIGQYFAALDDEQHSDPIPYSTFESLGWNVETYIEYLNCVDIARSSLILIRIKDGGILFSDKSEKSFYNTAFTYFADFIKKSTGITIDPNKFLKNTAYLNSVYYSNSQYYECGKSFIPSILLGKWDELVETSPQVFLHLSQDYFRCFLEMLIGRAARHQELLSIVYGDDEKNKRKLEYSSYKSIQNAIYELQSEQTSATPPTLSSSDLSSMDALWASAEHAADYWMRVQEVSERVDELEEFLDEWSDDPWFSSKKGVLYVCRGMVKCMRDSHTVKSVTGIIPSRSGLPVEVNMNYCVECDKFFITEKDFEFYRKKYGLIAAHFVFETSDGVSSPYNELAEQSPLKLCGYSVSATEGYSAEERQGLLSAIIDNEIMTKPDVLSYLNWFIQYNGSKPGNEMAVGKWKEDIKFVRDYRIGEQTHCYISEVRQWGK